MSETAAPELRFPEFGEEWILKEVEESFPFIRNGFVGTATPYYRDKGIPYFQGRNIQNGTLSKQADIFISEEFHQSKSKSQLKSGDMLMVQSGHVGHTAVYDYEEEANCHAILVMTPKEDVIPHWFNYLFQSDIGLHEIYKIKTGNTIEHVLSTDVKKIKLATPYFSEQKKIAEFLSTVDAKLAAVDTQLAGWREYKRGMMQALFSQRLRFKADDGSDFPDWEQKRLGNYFTDRSERGHDDLLLLAVTMHRGVIDRNRLAKGDTSSKDKSNYKRVEVGDIAYNSMRMWQGASGRSQLEGIISPAYTVITPTNKSNSEFFAFLFKWRPMIFAFQRHSQGLTSDTWNLKFPALSTIKVIVPTSLEEQRKIATALSSIDVKIEALTYRLMATREFKRGLLQKMFV